jgi:outer membrane protein
MNKLHFCLTLLASGVILTTSLVSASNQVNPGNTFASDSLSLTYVINEVISTHPTVKAAEEALQNADARIDLAKTGYYPVVDASANFSNIGPIMKFDIPSIGKVQLYPANNYSASVNFRQVIYDFGRTRANIDIENEGKIIGVTTLDQVRQKMALATINSFYNLAFLQHAITIIDEQITTLQAHLRYVETMKATGSATDYQVLSTKVKISQAESQRSDLLASLAIQQAYLCSLTGKEDKNPIVKEELNVLSPAIQGDSLMSFALRNRFEMSINREKAEMAQLRYNMTKTMNKPVINFMASAGTKNGYLPDLAKLKANYVLGIGMVVPLFDGMKTKYNLRQAESAINSAGYESEGTKRIISTEIREAEEYMSSARQKELQFALQLDQALQAYSLAETSFRAGAITNLELLDANTSVSQSRLMLLKARIDYNASIYRFRAALGEKLWQTNF